MRRRSFAGAELVVNLSASPFRVGIAETRREMIATRAADCQATLAYVNLFGANDGLVFDGGGIVAQNGRVLLDAPCSGLGTLRQHPEIRWRRSAADVEASARRQGHLLATLFDWLRPSGTLVYATCTLLRAENEDVVRAAEPLYEAP